MEFFKDLFANKILTDTRLHPILTFSLPFHHHPSSTTFGLFPPTSETWLQLSYYVLLQIPIQCAFAFLIYTTIIPHRGTTKAYLIGWGFIIPLSCGMPFWILECLDVRNKVVKLAGGNIMSIVGFRCVEAMYGTPPSPVVEASLSNYVAYYNTLVPFVWDEKTQARKRVTAGEILRTVVWLVFVFHAYSLLLSFMIHYDFKPFPNDHVELDQFHLTLDLFTPQHFANGYLLAVLTYLNLSLGFGATALGNKLQGHSTVPIFRNPLFASRTPTEFWTRRWNVMIHLMMKYGVFRPMRRMVGGSVAVVVAFVVSGLFHEYAWAIDFYPNGCTTVDDGSDGIGFFRRWGVAQVS